MVTRTFIPHAGSLTCSPADIIIHGCNQQNSFGSGVAGAISDDLPYAKRAYHKAFENERPALGDIIVARPPTPDAGPIVLNAITQEFYGRRARRYVSYEAIERAFSRLGDVINDLGGQRVVGLPKIGAGLSGGDWDTISEIILRVTAPDIKLVLSVPSMTTTRPRSPRLTLSPKLTRSPRLTLTPRS